MYKIGDVVVCIDNEPKQDYVFYDFVSYMLEFHKINPLEINKTYTIKKILSYWGDDGNCYESLDDTSSRYESTSYILDEIEKKYGYSVYDMTRFISVKGYRKLKLNKLNEIS